jgi:hypothetical protein
MTALMRAFADQDSFCSFTLASSFLRASLSVSRPLPSALSVRLCVRLSLWLALSLPLSLSPPSLCASVFLSSGPQDDSRASATMASLRPEQLVRRKRFVREAQLLESLRHPKIVQYVRSTWHGSCASVGGDGVIEQGASAVRWACELTL